MIDYAYKDRRALIRSVEPNWFDLLEHRFIMWFTSPPEW